jgi:hypothetical protein
MRRLLLAIACLTTSLTVCADGPQYQVQTQLRGLAVNYNVENNNIETILYATNHEKFPVVCDASMNTNRQEKSKGKDTLIAPQKTGAFSFRHGKSITKVQLFLVCEAAKNADTYSTTDSHTDTNTQPPQNDTHKTQQPKPVTVIEENLDRF